MASALGSNRVGSNKWVQNSILIPPSYLTTYWSIQWDYSQNLPHRDIDKIMLTNTCECLPHKKHSEEYWLHLKQNKIHVDHVI